MFHSNPSKTYRIEVKDILVVIGLGVLSWCILFKLKFEPLLFRKFGYVFGALMCHAVLRESSREKNSSFICRLLLLLEFF